MSLILNDNAYCGMLSQSLSQLVTIGSNDFGLWHVDAATVNGNKVRMAYVDADVVIQEIDSLCDFQDLGDVEVSFMNLTLKTTGSQQTICKTKGLYKTDFASAGGGFQNQEVDPTLLNEWALKFTTKFSKAAQRERWSGNESLSGSSMNGIVVKIQSKGAFDAVSNPTGYQQLANTPVTSANVIVEMKKVLDELPFEVTSHPMFKIILAPAVAQALRSAVMVPTTVNNLMQLDWDVNTGRVMSNFFGYSVYMAEGLSSPLVPANNNIIMAGIFGAGNESSIKAAFNKPDDEKSIEIKDVQDGDFVRLRIATGQQVAVIPNASQIAMNA